MAMPMDSNSNAGAPCHVLDASTRRDRQALPVVNQIFLEIVAAISLYEPSVVILPTSAKSRTTGLMWAVTIYDGGWPKRFVRNLCAISHSHLVTFSSAVILTSAQHQAPGGQVVAKYLSECSSDYLPLQSVFMHFPA